jgi:hypothetical protein
MSPVPLPPKETGSFILVFAQKKWPIEIKNMEKRIIIEDVDRCSMRTVAQGICLLTSQYAKQGNDMYLCSWDSSLVTP